MTAAGTSCFALNVYHWDWGAQDRLLARCLGPAARALWDAGRLTRFWHYRFDVRGPHVGVILGAPAEAADEACAGLRARLDAYLAAFPCTAVPAPGELQTRHDACRATLCAMDREPGLAPNNSVRIASHPPDGYFLHQAAGVADADALWALLGELAFWTIGLVAAGTRGAAVRWIAAVDGALRRTGAPAEACWRHYAGSLLLGMDDRLRADAEAASGTVARLVGERNRAALSRVWAEVEDAPPWPGTDRLVARVMADDGRSLADRCRLLRTINHSVLAQLGQPAELRIPLVLYAWLRSVQPAPAAC